ncbi:MAG: shikimate dehydrogenase, partial [Clostridiales bacterium]
VEFIKKDPLSCGALVTTHKLDLYEACKDLFEYLDPYALMFHEMSSISKRDGMLCGHAKDPISSGLALSDFVPKNWWSEHGGDFYVIGAGGSAISMGSYLMREEFRGNYPQRIIVSNRSKPRLDAIEAIFKKLDPGGIAFEYKLCPEPEDNDRVLSEIRPYSVVVNATGLGKDRPGSPLSDACVFPKESLVWEINYRGELNFMHQANAQAGSRKLHVEDGWRYFIYGWTQVIAEVFHLPIEGELLNKLDKIAKDFR